MRKSRQSSGLTRRDFLKLAGAGAMGLTGASMLGVQAYRAYGPDERPGAFQLGGSDMNVVLITMDTLRKDHIGAYGNGWIQTPNLDALAGESLRFTDAYPESGWTIPARRAIHTGIRTFPFDDYDPAKGENVLAYGWQPIPQDQTTLAEILKSRGYTTMMVTDNVHKYKPSMNFHRGFDVFEFIRGQEKDLYRPLWMCPEEKIQQSLMKSRQKVEGKLRQYFANTSYRRAEEDWFAPQVFRRASDFLEGVKESESPFFMAVDAFDPHEPWDPPEEYVDLYSDGYDGPEPYVSVYGDAGYLSEEELQRMGALYAAEVTLADRWLGRFMDKLEELGLMETTAIVFLSDHGHALGDHDIVGKPFWGLWPEVVNVPFFIRHPEGRGAGEENGYFASTHDVAPTILGLLGIGAPAEMQGEDLSVLLDGGEPASRPYATLGVHDYVWARDDRYVMISQNDGSRAKLYDLEEDPEQNKNVAWRNPDVVNRMFEEYVLKDAGGGPLPNYNL